MEKRYRILSTFTVLLFILTFILGNEVKATNTVHLLVNGSEFTEGEIIMLEGRTYIPVRNVTELLGAEVGWNPDTKEVSIQQGELHVSFNIGQYEVHRNDLVLVMDAPSFIKDNITYVPIRFVSEALNYKVGWNSSTWTVSIDKKPVYVVRNGDTLDIISNKLGISPTNLKIWNKLPTDELLVNQELLIEPVEFTTVNELKVKAIIEYQEDELEWLAKIIFSEAQDEPLEGQIAVGAVVIHRVLDTSFPNSIKDVIFEPNQFTPVSSGKIFKIVPDANAYEAAKEALIGNDPVKGALFFFNPEKSTSTFFDDKELIQNIGHHRFVR